MYSTTNVMPQDHRYCLSLGTLKLYASVGCSLLSAVIDGVLLILTGYDREGRVCVSIYDPTVSRERPIFGAPLLWRVV